MDIMKMIRERHSVRKYLDKASAPNGNMTRVDLGIVAYHFEAATGVKVQMS